MVDGGWWMVDGGWWMVDGGWWMGRWNNAGMVYYVQGTDWISVQWSFVDAERDGKRELIPFRCLQYNTRPTYT